MVKVKGNLCYQLKNYVLENYDADAFKELAADVPEFQGLIVSSKQYDLEAYQKILHAFKEKYGDEAFVGMCRYMAEKQLGGIFGFFIKFVSLEKLVPKVQFMWSTVFTEGQVEVLQHDDKVLILRISEFPMSETHLEGIEIYMKALVEIAIKRQVKSSSKMIDQATSEFTLDLHP